MFFPDDLNSHEQYGASPTGDAWKSAVPASSIERHLLFGSDEDEDGNSDAPTTFLELLGEHENYGTGGSPPPNHLSSSAAGDEDDTSGTVFEYIDLKKMQSSSSEKHRVAKH